jgi:hypothetical protein
VPEALALVDVLDAISTAALRVTGADDATARTVLAALWGDRTAS